MRSSERCAPTAPSIYDYSGQRVAKVEGGKVTRYLGGGYELEDDSVIRKYISAGDRRIAMRKTTVADGSAARWPDELAPVVVAAADSGTQ